MLPAEALSALVEGIYSINIKYRLGEATDFKRHYMISIVTPRSRENLGMELSVIPLFLWSKE